MPHHVAGHLMYLAFLLPSFACAEQRFYQVVDPDGHVRTIKVPHEPGQDAEMAASASAADDQQPDRASEPAHQSGALPMEKESPKKFAPYNGDVYLDSEHLESSQFNPEQKKKFYIINDGLGSRVEQSAAGATETPEMKTVESGIAVGGMDLPLDREEIIDEASMKALLATSTLCVATQTLEQSKNLLPKRLDTLILDKKAWQYREPPGVGGAYRFSADGMKTLTLRSYARNERAPDFVSPALAMADDKGCIKRIVTGYFQSRYEATKAKHSMLEGEVTIHADEPYVFVILSEYQRPADTSYQRSQFGQFSIRWQP